MSLGLSVLGLLLGLFDLLLLYGVIRRLKEIEARPAHAAPAPVTGITEAHRMTAGAMVDIPDGTRPTLVAFFAPGCEPCEQLLPLVLTSAMDEPGGSERVVAILSEGTDDDNARFTKALEPVPGSSSAARRTPGSSRGSPPSEWTGCPWSAVSTTPATAW